MTVAQASDGTRSTRSLAWSWRAAALAVAIALHNVEEFLTYDAHADRLERLAQSYGWALPDLTGVQIAIALGLATAVPAAILIVCGRGPLSRLKIGMIGVIAAGLLGNALFPHIAATALAGGYTPGVASAAIVNLPLTIWLLAMVSGNPAIGTKQFLAIVLVGFAVLPVAIAVFLAIARAISG